VCDVARYSFLIFRDSSGDSLVLTSSSPLAPDWVLGVDCGPWFIINITC
jgi:hypothetical protein